MRFSCQYCGSDITARTTRAGELASCRLCGIENVIPEGLFHRLRIRGLLLWGFTSAFVLGFIDIALKSPDSDSRLKYVWLLWFHTLILVWSLWKIKRLRLNARRIIGRVPESQKWLKTAGIVLPLILFAIGSGGLYVQFLSWISPSFAEEWFEAEELSAFHIFFLIVMVPPIEELFFRGILIHRWAEKWDIKRAVFASTIIFATLHKNMIGALAYGFVLSVLYIKTRTLIVPVVCHILINLLAVSISAAGSRIEMAASELIFSLVCLILSIPWLIYFVRKNWPERSWNLPYFANKVDTVSQKGE